MPKRGIVIAVAIVAVLATGVALFDWNWLRDPLARYVTTKTGRVLRLDGDLSVRLRWPALLVRAKKVSFANPAWAREPQMVVADAADLSIDIGALFTGTLSLSEVRLEQPVVVLERSADGRKNWLLDLGQQDENARLHIGRLRLDHGRLSYDDSAAKTSIQALLDTRKDGAGVDVSATGKFKDMPLKLAGSGGPVLALRDETTPYPLKLDGSIGATRVKADGSITSLIRLTALDVNIDLSGDSLARLYPLIGIALPETHPYSLRGRLRHTGAQWSLEKFSGLVGKSDLGGTLAVDTAVGKRPFLHGDLATQRLDIADLGPVVGARALPPKAARTVQTRVLPDMAFNTQAWDSADADVHLLASSIVRAKEMPINHLDVRIGMRDRVLTLAPLNLDMAGGRLESVVTLDGKKDPIDANATIHARKIQIGQLFPTVDLTRSGVGQVNGLFELSGTGHSIGEMLATANGKVGLVVEGGRISNLMMEIIGLDIFEALKFKVLGDKTIPIRCAVADFKVRQGLMTASALVFDTTDTNVVGSGSISLAKETLDLTLKPQPKDGSPLVLRSPFHVGGTFAKPDISVNKTELATRGLGAVALGLINPLLAILPLIETAPGVNSPCADLIRHAEAVNTYVKPIVKPAVKPAVK